MSHAADPHTRLDYATPMPPRRRRTLDGWIQTLGILCRRLMFAAGCGLLAGGVGQAWVHDDDVRLMMGCGAGLVGLTVPLGRWLPNWTNE